MIEFATGLLLEAGDAVGQAKEVVEDWSLMTPGAAWHILIGVLAQLVIAAFVRRGIASFIPWGVVLAAETVNEVNDIYFRYWDERPYAVSENVTDAVLTMILPTILLVLARVRPQIFGLRADTGNDANLAADGDD